MPKHKPPFMHGPKSKSKKKPAAPETADEFQAEGVEFEEAGEKWRAGDSAKSCRFFGRALDSYETGLQRFPQSFDLAYNRARLQFDIAQQPRLLQHLPVQATDLLQTALNSHRYALALNAHDPDTLFNTAQILTSLAETAIGDSSTSSQESAALPLQFLQEAHSFFEQCLLIQTERYTRFVEATTQYDNLRADEATAVSASREQEPAKSIQPESQSETADNEVWAAIEEPVKQSTLLDTCLAAVQSMATLVLVVQSEQSKLQEIEQRCSILLSQAESYFDPLDTEASEEFCIVKAKLASALLRANFNLGSIAAKVYASELDKAFLFADRTSTLEALSESAEARVSFNTACIQRAAQLGLVGPDPAEILDLRWHQLTRALADLTKAANLASNPIPWTFQARKAEAELLRARLGDAPDNLATAQGHRLVLLRNAEVYYRGAKNLATAAGEMDFASDMAARESVVKSLRGEAPLDSRLGSTVVEMLEEGLIAENFQFHDGD